VKIPTGAARRGRCPHRPQAAHQYKNLKCPLIFRLILFKIIPVIFLITFLSTQALYAQQKFVFEQPKMGSPFTISIFAKDSAKAAQAATVAFHCADSLNQIFSDYLDSSELNHLNATSGQNRYVPVSTAMFDILKYAVDAARKSKGSYDISMGPVVRLWRQARKEKKLPDEDSLQSALKKVGYQFIHLDTVHQSVWLEKAGMQLDLGGLGKGYVAQAALNIIQDMGSPSSMVNAGGKIAIGKAPPGRNGWRIGITLPGEREKIMQRLLLLNNTSVATSGDIYQHLDINGKRYSHIVDPKTGLGITSQRNVTVIARNGVISDWLATACSILPIDEALELVRTIDGAALLITEMDNGKLIQKSSENFKDFFEN